MLFTVAEKGSSERSRVARYGVAAVLVTGVLAFGGAMFATPDGIASGDAFRDNDWLNCRSFDLITRDALLNHGQFPLRSHLIGGGFPVVAHPSDGSWAPTLLAVLLFGDVLGVKLNLLAMLLVGTWGVYGLARRWLGLAPAPAVFAALLFAFSGWAPAMLLVGFYNQALYLLAPAVLWLLISGVGRPARLLWAGLLLAVVLQQGGNAFPTVCHFLGLVCWFVAADEAFAGQPAWKRWWRPGALLLTLTLPFGLAKGLGVPLVVVSGFVLAAAWVWRSAPLRGFLRALAPWAGRLGLVVVVALTLGAARIVGLVYLAAEGEYERGLDELRYWFPMEGLDEHWVERFYEAPGVFLTALAGRVPGAAAYGEAIGREGENVGYEYAWLGLTWGALALALAGAALSRRRPEVQRLGLLFVLYAAICAGWHVPPDFHFMLVWGLPWLGEFGQPLKYYNFYLLVALVLLAGVGVSRIRDAVPAGLARQVVTAGLMAALVMPFVQNRAMLGELFALPQPAPAVETEYRQQAMIADPSWLALDGAEIRRRAWHLRLREFRRPLNATEYHNVRRNTGTVDWYGTVVMAEHALPHTYVTPDGQTFPNLDYRGEAWVADGIGRVRSVRVTPNHIDLDVDLRTDALVVINQNHLSGFSTDVGEVRNHQGLLAVWLGRGQHQLRVTYRPAHLLAGLGVSAAGFVAWFGALVTMTVRRKR
jgi:hypothetical protein